MKKMMRKFWLKITPTQFVVLGYLTAVMVSTLLLWLPVSHKEGVKLSFIDAMFTATSGISVTGLNVVNTAETFNVFGTIVLMLMFQFGGIGIMTLGTFLWLLLGRNISLSYRQLIMVDQNRHNLSGLVRLMKIIFGLSLLFETFGTLLFAAYFYFSGYAPTWYESLYLGLFHAVSSYTNAGFDIFGNSLADFSNDYFVQVITMALIILGAIGFPVLVEVREYVLCKDKKLFRFSLFTKITSVMFFTLMVFGSLGIWIIEQDLYFADKSWHEKLFFALFNSVTTRSAGLSTMDLSDFSIPTQIFLSILMFIGGSPSSTGGGIRTTTFALIILTIATYARGKNEVRVLGRSLLQEDILKSFVVFTVAIILVMISIISLHVVELQRFTLTEIVFEVTSAFGTCGLSTGITGELSTAGKTIIMFLMFIGRVGVLSLLFIFQTKKRKENVHYPREKIIIG
jgi:potassium uptake TrkH family protein